MGSFTSLASKEVINAIFPTAAADLTVAGTNLTSLATAANASVLKIYTHATAGSVGLFAGGNGGNAAVVRHRVDLIANAAAGITALLDGYIGANGITSGGAGTGTNAGYGFANYTNYQGMCTVNSGVTGNHAWFGWNIAASSETTGVVGSWKVVTNGQIGFPQNGGTAQNIHGFVISAAQTSTNTTVSATTGLAGAPNSTSAILASPPSSCPVVIAYGDLSSVRTVNNSDTPVFTSGAIVITLD